MTAEGEDRWEPSVFLGCVPDLFVLGTPVFVKCRVTEPGLVFRASLKPASGLGIDRSMFNFGDMGWGLFGSLPISETISLIVHKMRTLLASPGKCVQSNLILLNLGLLITSQSM